MKKKTKEESWKKKEESNFRKKKKGASWKKVQKYKKKGEKRERKALWITIVIHSVFRCGETMISPHPLVLCIIV